MFICRLPSCTFRKCRTRLKSWVHQKPARKTEDTPKESLENNGTFTFQLFLLSPANFSPTSGFELTTSLARECKSMTLRLLRSLPSGYETSCPSSCPTLQKDINAYTPVLLFLHPLLSIFFWKHTRRFDSLYFLDAGIESWRPRARAMNGGKELC